MSRLGEKLQGLVDGEVRFDDITRQLYANDASIFQCKPLCVVFPKNTDDVVAAVRFAAENHLPVRPRGSGTGIQGDVLGEGIVLDFTKYMRRIFHTGLDSVTVEPGILVRRLNGILEKTQSRRIPSITGNPHSTAIGSVIARNAAGLYCRREGRIDSYVTELKTVLANGDVLHLNRQKLIEIAEEHVEKYEGGLNTAIELAQEIAFGKEYTYAKRLSKILGTQQIDLVPYFIGSRGTLGLIVEATLQTVPMPQRGAAFAMFFESTTEAVAAVKKLGEPVLCELIDQRSLILIRDWDERYKKLIPPETGALLLTEYAAETDGAAQPVPAEQITPQYYRIETGEHYVLFDELIQRSLAQAPAARVKPVPLNEGFTVPVEHIETFVADVMNVLQEHQITASLSGHIGQGQVRITPLIDFSQPNALAPLPALATAVRALLPPQDNAADSRIRLIFDPQQIFSRTGCTVRNAAGAGSTVDAKTKTLVKQLRWEPEHFAETVMRCNNCGDCFRYDRQSRICPVFRGTPAQFFAPRCKAAFVRNILDGSLELNALTDKAAYEIADSCFQCRMCDTECPSETDVAQIAFEIKSAYNAAHGMALDELVFSRIDTVLNVLTAVGCPVNSLLKSRFVRWLLETALQIPRGQTIPPLAKIPFLRKVQLSRWLSRPRIEYFGKERIALFVDTYSNFFDPQLAESAVRILEHNGISVEVPPHQKPSGLTAFAAGHKSLAAALAQHNTAMMTDYIRQGYRIVTFESRSASCIIQDYRYFIEANEAAVLAENVSDICTFLWRRHLDGKLLTNFKALPCRIGYHAPCRSIAMNRLRTNEAAPAELLLRLIPDMEVQRLESGCCGGGGSFGFRQKHYRQSLQIGTPLFKALKEPNIDFGVSECHLCCWQMSHGSRKPAQHPVRLLAQAYELSNG